MMKADVRSSDVKAGLLVLLAIAILFTFLIMITGLSLKTETKQYVTRFGYSSGIQAGTVVRLGGVLVGKVDRVYFPEDDKTKIEVLLTVKADAPIRRNSEAYITSIGIMGDYYVEVTAGTPEAEPLPDGSILNSKDVPTLVQFGAQMAEPFERITTEVETLLRNLNGILDEQNTKHISSMVGNLDTLIGQNQDAAQQITQNLAKMTENLQAVTERLDKMMLKNSDNLSTTLERLTSSMVHADSLLVQLVRTTSQLNYMLTSNETNLYEVLENLQDVSNNFEIFSRKLKEQPWSLVRKTALPRRELPEN